MGSVEEILGMIDKKHLEAVARTGKVIDKDKFMASELANIIKSKMNEVVAGEADAKLLWELVAKYLEIQYRILNDKLKWEELTVSFTIDDVVVSETGVSYTITVSVLVDENKTAKAVGRGVVDLLKLAVILDDKSLDEQIVEILKYTTLSRRVIDGKTVFYVYRDNVLAGVYYNNIYETWYAVGMDIDSGELYGDREMLVKLMMDLGLLTRIGEYYVLTVDAKCVKRAKTNGSEVYMGFALDNDYMPKYVVLLDYYAVHSADYWGSLESMERDAMVQLLSRLYAGLVAGNEDVELIVKALEPLMRMTGLYKKPEYAKFYKLVRMIKANKFYHSSSGVPILMSSDRVMGVLLRDMVGLVFGELEPIDKQRLEIRVEATTINPEYKPPRITKLVRMPSAKKICREATGSDMSCEVFLVADGVYFDYTRIYRLVKSAGESDNIYMIKTKHGKILGLGYGDVIAVIAPYSTK